MPEGPGDVEIRLNRATLTLPWPSVDTLLDEFRHLEPSQGLRDALDEARAASHPVRLSNEQKGELIRLIDFWTQQLGGGYHDLPQRIWDLRNALIDDLHDTKADAT